MAAFKSWADHSDRWKREALRDGLSPKRWDAWQRLSPSSRKATHPRQYAQGVSVREQKLRTLRTAAAKNLVAKTGAAEKRTARNIAKMTPAELRFAARATEKQLRRRAKTNRLFWYH